MRMWHHIQASVRGKGHADRGVPCQDSHSVLLQEGVDSVLIAAVADGAGSALRSEIGARLCCEAATEMAAELVQSGRAIRSLSREEAISWLQLLRCQLEEQADRDGYSLRDYAATLLLSIVGTDGAAFLQVGDGAIVRDCGGGMEAVFWPHHGEFINETVFVTSDWSPSDIQFTYTDGPTSALAMFSDGLEPVALDVRQQRAFAPFFEPFLRGLERCSDASLLRAPLVEFLESERLSQKSDDDKTLVVAIARADPDASQQFA